MVRKHLSIFALLFFLNACAANLERDALEGTWLLTERNGSTVPLAQAWVVRFANGRATTVELLSKRRSEIRYEVKGSHLVSKDTKNKNLITGLTQTSFTLHTGDGDEAATHTRITQARLEELQEDWDFIL